MYKTIDVIPVLDTSAYASGDLLFNPITILNVFTSPSASACLLSLGLVDRDDQGVAFDLYFMNASTTFGTINSAPTISDAGGGFVQAIVPIATADWKDLGGVRVANIKNIWSVMSAVSGGTNLYVAAVNGAGTPTFTAAGLTLRLGLDV